MAVTALPCFPAAITAGDTVRLQLSFGNYSASAWSGTLRLNQAGGKTIDVAGTANGAAFVFVITSAISAKLAGGQWRWAARMTDGSSEIATAQAGYFTVIDGAKSLTQKQLDAANATLSILLENPDAVVSFNGQTFTKDNQAQLLDVINRLEIKARRELEESASLEGDAPTRSIRPYFV